MRKKAAILLYVITLLLVFLPLFAQAAPIGKFTSVEGNVDITPPGKEARPVKLGDPVNVGEVIRTKSKSKCEVTFIDGTILRLAESSRLRVSDFTQEKDTRTATLNLFRGKIQNVVKTVTGAAAEKSKYEIRTPTAVAGVRGTQFFVYYQAGISGAVVAEGTIYAYSTARPEEVRIIGTGEAMVVTDPNLPPAVRRATETEIKQLEKDTRPTEKPREAGKEEEKPTAEAPKIVEAAPAADEAERSTKVDIVARGTQPPPKEEVTTVAPPTGPYVPPSADTKPPTITAVTLPGTVTRESSATLSFKTDEPALVSFSIDGGAWQSDPQAAPDVSFNFSLNDLSEGQHTFALKAQDAVGNVSSYTYAWKTDYTAPAITLSNTPSSLTNANTAAIAVSVVDANPGTVTYALDGNVVQSPNLTALPEGEHTFVVTAIDAAGNQSTKSYTWTTDYTAPEVTLSGFPKKVTGNDTNTFSFTATDAHMGSRYYRVDGGDWQAFNDDTAISFAEGKRKIEFKATDLAGNERISDPYEWFIGKRSYILEGSITGSLTGTVSEGSEGLSVISSGTTGAWLLEFSGSANPVAGNISAVAGGKAFGPDNPGQFDGYWLSHITGTANDGSISGTSSLTYLSSSTLGRGEGVLTGTYGNSWQAQDLGFGTYTETPLAFGGSVGVLDNNGFQYWDDQNKKFVPDNQITRFTGLLGGTVNFWDGQDSFIMMGKYANPNNRTFWYIDFTRRDLLLESGNPCDFNMACQGLSSAGASFENVGYHGGMAGVVKDNSLFGQGIALYIKPAGQGSYEAGYFKFTDITGSFYPGLGMWEAEGKITAVSKGTTTIVPENLYDGSDDLRGGDFGAPIGDGAFSGFFAGSALHLSDQNWGVWLAGIVGNYTQNGVPTGTWQTMVGRGETGTGDNNYWWKDYFIATISGGAWGSGRLSATLSGYEINMQSDGKNYLAELSGTIQGIYASGTLQAGGVGTTEEKPLMYGGFLGEGDYVFDLYYNNDGYLGYAGIAKGVFGGTETPWPTGADFYAIGNYRRLDYGMEPLLWCAAVGGNVFLSQEQGFTGGFRGEMVGIWSQGILTGALRAIYITPPDQNGYVTAGVLGGDLAGKFYPEIGMWAILNNTIVPMSIKTEGISLSSIVDQSGYPNIGAGNFSAVWRGSFDGASGSSISGGGLDNTTAGSLTYLSKLDNQVYDSLPWGIYLMNLESYYNGQKLFSDTPTGDATFSGLIGGKGVFGSDSEADFGYFLATMKGTWSVDGKIEGTLGAKDGDSSTFGKYLTLKHMGDIGGPLYGVAGSGNSGTWVGVSVGSYQGTPLTLGGSFSGDYAYVTSNYSISHIGNLHGLFGSTSSLSERSVPLTGIFEFENPGIALYTPLYTLDIIGYTLPYSGAVPMPIGTDGIVSIGYGGGVIKLMGPDTDVISLYYKERGDNQFEVGYLTAEINKNYKSMLTAETKGIGMTDGEIQAIYMETVSSLPKIPTSFAEFLPIEISTPLYNVITDQSLSIAAMELRGTSLYADSDFNWGIFQAITGGTYNFTVSNPTAVYAVHIIPESTYTTMYMRTETNWDTGRIEGKGYFARIAIEDSNPMTMVGAGKIKGGFDPQNTVWLSVTTGAWLETGKFIDLASSDAGRAKLDALNIPAVLVGQATLSQQGGPTNNLSNVTLSNVGFYAYVTGEVPKIWATNNVTGNFSGTPSTDTNAPSVPLSGGGLTADFRITTWQNNVWRADITGSGNLSGGSYTGAVNFIGGAAGNINATNSSFSGTAAGVVK